MKIFRLSLILLSSLAFAVSFAEEVKHIETLPTYSVSEINAVITKKPTDLLNKVIILSSCGVSVMECNSCDSHAVVKHIDDLKYFNNHPSKTYDPSKLLRVYGTEIQRSLGRRIGYNMCGLYKGTVQPNPYSKRTKPSYIFVVESIIEQHLIEREKRKIEKRKRREQLKYIFK